jgi:hypothetical protein
MFLKKKSAKRGRFSPIGYPIVILSVAIIIASYQSSAAGDLKQKTFHSPDEAVTAMIDSIRTKEKGVLLAIFGPSGKEIISSGDEVVDREMGERFVKAYDEGNKLVSQSDTKMVLQVGKDDFPFPIPIVKKGGVWLFDTQAGKEEILNRRIGRNELSTIQVCLAYVDAQREYARISQASGLMEYAQRFASSPGKKDGLYWETKEGDPQSPLGPLVAEAVKEGYQRKESGKQAKEKTLTPYHGYHYKILKAQGKNASGGEYDYLIKDKMIGGFALVAYPAEYGLSGVMTFIVNQDGAVYEKDLGKDTEKIASAMKKFDPDKTWKKTE